MAKTRIGRILAQIVGRRVVVVRTVHDMGRYGVVVVTKTRVW